MPWISQLRATHVMFYAVGTTPCKQQAGVILLPIQAMQYLFEEIFQSYHTFAFFALPQI